MCKNVKSEHDNYTYIMRRNLEIGRGTRGT